MKVKSLMTRPVCSIGRWEAIEEAARLMDETGVDALTILDNGKLVGIVTGRDISVRAIGRGVSPHEPVSTIMTRDVQTCDGEMEAEDALDIMAEQQIRRMPVCNTYGRLIGMISRGVLGLPESKQEQAAGPRGAHCRRSATVG
jgi:CBS domain-containing protein